MTAGFAAMCTLLVVLGGRLVQLQALDGPQYENAALKPNAEATVIPADRGRIVDRDGRVLAYSVASRLVFADPKLARDHAEATAAALAPLLAQPAATLEPKLRKAGTRYSVLARDVTPTNAARIVALKLPGISTEDTTQRLYPSNTGAAVLGFTGRDGTGLAGIELKYNDTLSGKPGEIVAEAGSAGEEIPGGERRETPAVPGSSVRLTLDEDLQYTAQQALTNAVRQTHALDGQAVVLDVRTGQVLAMASAAVVDPHKPAMPDPRQYGNPAVQSVFEPGSANKVVTFAAALDRGVIKPDTRLTVPGSIQVADRVIHDAWVHGPAKWTATGVLAQSSNVGTLMIAKQVGPSAFYDYLTRFGIGSRTGVQLPGESGGLLPKPADWSGSTFGNLPIGQGVSMTALQLASMYQAIGNDGVRVPPRIIAGVTGPDGRTSAPAAPQPTRVVSQATSRTVRSMLETVTETGGTGTTAAIDGYGVAGKTGTAQKPDPKCGCYSDRYWATFAGVVPAGAPRFAIAIMVDDAKGGLHGGAVAAPLFHMIATYALGKAGIPPTGAGRPIAPLDWN
ncbi:MAG TPA: penicillin-binding protein 2 [Mycobacteriales bacterium]|nr:penicillin-binding protein 2 [Mycobacteriales bacterium]